MILCFDSQGDRPEIAGEMILAVIELMIDYEDQAEYDVVDVDADEWHSTTPFEDLPRIKMTTSSARAQAKGLP